MRDLPQPRLPRPALALALAAVLARGGAGQAAHELADRGRVALEQALLDAGTDQLVLFVASHPDDQYIQPAAVMRFRHGWRTAVALLTRGEGGQNISGPETGDALARRRAEETARCAARLGLTVHHLGRPDAGFCRTAEETLELWGRSTTIDDLARIIRALRPDVVWTTHHPAEEHGHDLGLIELLPGAVQRAAAAGWQPEGLPPHEVRALVRACAPGEAADCTLPGDGVDAVRGDSYRRLAWRALEEHRSQAPHRELEELFPPVLQLRSLPVGAGPPTRDPFAAPPDLFADLAARSEAEAAASAARAALGRLLAARAAPAPELVERALAARAALAGLAPRAPWTAARRARRVDAVERVVVHGLGLARVATVGRATVAAGSTLPVLLTIQNSDVRDLDAIVLRAPFAAGGTQSTVGPLPRGASAVQTLELRAPATPDPASLAPPQQLGVTVEMELAGQTLAWPVPLQVDVRPPVEIAPTRPAFLLARGRDSVRVAVGLHNHSGTARHGHLQARAPVPLRCVPEAVDTVLPPGAERIYMFTLDVPATVRGVQSVRFHFADAVAEFSLHAVDVRVPADLRVGLVPGVDDTSRRVLEDLGVQLHILDGDDVATYELDRLHTVLVDIRALRVQPTARAAFDRLLAFVRRGGRLVVLYHKDKEWEAPGFEGAPYPLRIGRERVTREDAPVEVLRPDHPLLREPNPLLPSDWDGWIQERGLHFASEHDDRYEALLAMADPGQPSQRGSLLYARYGEGEYVYCALALFRQLKKLHPGACRLFANLVSSPYAR